MKNYKKLIKIFGWVAFVCNMIAMILLVCPIFYGINNGYISIIFVIIGGIFIVFALVSSIFLWQQKKKKE